MIKSRRAFTLIELLVVIAIIGVLATISVIALSNARAKSRDAKRVGNMKQIQTALELFYNDNARYPTLEEWSSGTLLSTSSNATTTYMKIIPTAPTPADGDCSESENALDYIQTEDGASYSISFCVGNTVGIVSSGAKDLTPAGIVSDSGNLPPFVCGSSTIADADNNIYNTVEIGDQCWTAENLKVGSMVGYTGDQSNNSVIEKYCFYDDAPSCVTSGGFYQWAEALQLPFACNAVDCSSAPGDPCCAFEVPRQGICPSGWHIPSDAERLELNTYLGTTVGTKLKAAPGIWDGDNASGFNALPVGYRATWGGFPSQGIETRFWSSSATGSSVWTFYLNSSQSDLNHGNYEDRLSGISVRCIKD